MARQGKSTTFGGFVYVIDLKRYLDLRTQAMYDTEQFNILMGDDPDELPSSEKFLRDPSVHIVERVTYRPGGPRFLPEGGRSAVNLYRRSTLKPTDDDDARPWLDLVQHVVPDKRPREHLLDWLGHLVQHPDIKINHAVLLKGESGIGKDSILTPIIPALGSHDVGYVTPLELSSAFNAWLLNRTLIVVEELAAFETRSLMNKLKPLLTEPAYVVVINQKNVPTFEVPNIANYFFMTNEDKPLVIDSGDRRIFFYQSPAEPKSPAYYRAFYRWVDRHAAAVLGFLQRRDLSGFNPKAAPPMTSDKRALIEAGRPLLYQHLDHLIADNVVPDLVTLEGIADRLPGALRSTSPHRIADTLKELGGRRLRQVLLKNGRRPHLWAVRRPEMYVGEKDSRLAELFYAQRPGRSLPGVRVR